MASELPPESVPILLVPAILIPSDLESGPVVPVATPPPKVVKLAQTVIIDRSCETVFGYRSLLSNGPEWRRGVVSASLEGTGPICVGSHCTEVRSGKEDATEQWDLEVTEYEPARLLGIVERNGGVEVQEVHRFVREGSGTRYTVAVEVTGGSITAAAFQKLLLENVLQLKWAIEASSGSGPWNMRRQLR
ncbi:MAG: hypothetical protein EXR58_08555 [Chloroflexi bacterium]|nr:hypothetical protein [Chloroflexota bacterium]